MAGTYTILVINPRNMEILATTTFTDSATVTITSPTTASPVSVLPGGTVDVTYQITVSRLDQVVDRQISILTTPETTVNPSVIPQPLSSNTFSVTTTVTVPVGTAPGTYDVRVRVRQPATGGWQQEATNTGAVIVSSVSTVSITITSSPVTGSGFVKVDGTPITTPQTFTWTIGSTHTLEALSPVAGPTGTQYVWISWSDGGAQTHIY